MISTYKLFQIIFGLIVSGFILSFLIQYVSEYSEMQKTTQKIIILKNFIKTAEDVYLTGNYINFSDFSRYDFSSCYISLNQPAIKCRFAEIPVQIPLFFLSGEQMFIDRNSLDFGWWKMHVIEAIPETRIIFTPMDNSDDTWELMKDITRMLPSTHGFTPQTTFGFCNGDNLYELVCGGRVCERPDFLEVLDQTFPSTFASCNHQLSNNYRLVTISQGCSMDFVDQGICIQPPNSDGMGYAYIAGSDYLYKDPLDLVVLIIGGDEKDMLGISTLGEILYNYKNTILGERLVLASKIMKQRAILIAGLEPECAPVYANFANVLDSISNLAKGDYKNWVVMKNLVAKLNQAKLLYNQLEEMGCEYGI
jgi:hypothetical protein